LFVGASFALGYRYVLEHGVNPLTQIKRTERYTWRSVNRLHWQAIAGPSVAMPTASEAMSGRCPEGMQEIDGLFLLDPSSSDATGYVEELQNRACTNWISKEFPARCQTFDRAQWLELASVLPRRPLTFCMDRFEYPNVRGENPIIVVSYYEAQNLCRTRGKRLCNESEWTLACEGNEGKPYPYGYDRDPTACVVDRTWRQFKEGALLPRDGDGAREEVDRLWQASPSGSHPACKSSFGVYDMTGNVDEWTQTVRTSGYASILKGGYWGPVRARCRPSTRAHNEEFLAYQQGFRCCSDVPNVPASGSVVVQARARDELPARPTASREARGRSLDDVPKAIEDQSEIFSMADLETARPQVGIGQACAASPRQVASVCTPVLCVTLFGFLRISLTRRQSRRRMPPPWRAPSSDS